MSYEGAWRNRIHHNFTQYCYPHELEVMQPKLMQLIKKYGAAFDDSWQYRLRGRTRIVVVRKPLWLDVTESGRQFEKYRQPDRSQKKIEDYALLSHVPPQNE